MFRFFSHLKERIDATQFVYLTQQRPEPILRAAAQAGLESNEVLVSSATPDEVPEWLSLYQLGIFFLEPSYAAQATSFTKLGEFLAAGVPVVTNAGVGDVEEILSGTPAGFLFTSFDDQSHVAIAHQVSRALPIDSKRRECCRRLATQHFSLTDGCERYLSIYRKLIEGANRSSFKSKPREAA
jgi:glycosyltransferase involved in cell wall biosynthesis